MKPIKNFESISKWILRFALAAYIICLYLNEARTFDFKNLDYIINVIYIVFAVLLLFGGLAKGATLTIISGAFISVISIYKMYFYFYKIHPSFFDGLMYPAGYVFLMIFGIGLFFLSRGNS